MHPTRCARRWHGWSGRPLPSATRGRVVRPLALAGGYAGIVADLDRAEDLLRQAIGLADDIGEDRQGLVARIRLADVGALRGAPREAASQLERLLDHRRVEVEQHGLLDFVHQHLGKALLEAGGPDGRWSTSSRPTSSGHPAATSSSSTRRSPRSRPPSRIFEPRVPSPGAGRPSPEADLVQASWSSIQARSSKASKSGPTPSGRGQSVMPSGSRAISSASASSVACRVSRMNG